MLKSGDILFVPPGGAAGRLVGRGRGILQKARHAQAGPHSRAAQPEGCRLRSPDLGDCLPLRGDHALGTRAVPCVKIQLSYSVGVVPVGMVVT